MWRALNTQPEDLVKDSQRLKGLEADVKALRDATNKTQAELAKVNESLAKAQEERFNNPLVWSLSALLLAVLAAIGGAFVAARQSWLQWYPPEVASCGRDLYGMIENFPLQRAIPMIFRGSGDCAAVDWTFLGGSLANWSFVVFCSITLLCGTLLWRRVLARA